MADRSIAAGDTLNKLRFEFNGTAEDIGDISGITGASGIIASATDVVEAITALNTDLTTISTDNHIFEFQANASGGSGYNETITSTTWRAYHSESGSSTLEYVANDDLAQGTDHQHLANGVGNGSDEGLNGELRLFDPSNTTFVKNFIARCTFYEAGDMNVDFFTAGYINTTSAIDEIQFKMASGNIDSGTFKLYGIS